jgi:hypothetical protein
MEHAASENPLLDTQKFGGGLLSRSPVPSETGAQGPSHFILKETGDWYVGQRFQPLDVLVVGGGGGGTGTGAVGLTMEGPSPVPSGCGLEVTGAVLPRSTGVGIWEAVGLAGAWAATRMTAGTSKAKGGRIIGIGFRPRGRSVRQRFRRGPKILCRPPLADLPDWRNHLAAPAKRCDAWRI